MLKISHRRKARRYALQALYQWLMTAGDLFEIQKQFQQDMKQQQVDMDYFTELLQRIPNDVLAIDDLFTAYLDRSIDELHPVELTVIRIAVYELEKHPEIPYKVIIDEALELSKSFGSTEGYKYVNGILDRVAQHLRKSEIKQ